MILPTKPSLDENNQVIEEIKINSKIQKIINGIKRRQKIIEKYVKQCKHC